MFLLLRIKVMNWIKLIYSLVGVFSLQFILADFLSINGIRPDFVLIFILYIGLHHGSFPSIIVGFFLGLLVDFTGVGSFFGLTSLTYVITGYLSGFLHGKYYKMIPTYFHLTWLGIILFHFFIYSFIRYQDLFESTMTVFWLRWILTSGYTLGFLAIFQMIIPLQQGD